MQLDVYNLGNDGVELERLYLTFSTAVDWYDAGWSGGAIYDFNGSTLEIRALPPNNDIYPNGMVSFGFCSEPALYITGLEADMDTYDTGFGGSGDDDDDNDDDCDDDDDDDCDDDEDCFEYGELEQDGLFIVHMDAGYEVNCGDCLRLQVFTWATETEYEDLTITVQMTDNFDLTYAEGFYWEHDDSFDEIVLGGLYDPDMGEFDVWDGRICVNPRVWPAAILDLDYTSVTY